MMKNLTHLGLFQVCDSTAIAQPECNGVASSYGTYTKYVTPTDSNGQAHMTLNTKYLYADWWICSSKNLTHLGWFQVCDAIDVAQDQCNGVSSSIWDPARFL